MAITGEQGKVIFQKIKMICLKIAKKAHTVIVMILANLGQRSCFFRTTFPKYTDSILKSFGQRTLSQRDKLTS